MGGLMRGCPDCARMALRIDTLEEQARALKQELGLRIKDGVIGSLMTHLNLEPKRALILAALYEAKGRMVRHDHLIEFSGCKNSNALKTQVCRIKGALGANVIRTFGQGRSSMSGYGITPEGASLVLAAIEPPDIQPPRP
jgi:hypothetical protein